MADKGLSALCGWCSTVCRMTISDTNEIVRTPAWGGGEVVQVVLQCDGCGRYSLAEGRNETQGFSGPVLKVYLPGTLMPPSIAKKTFEDVPARIASLATEAHLCKSIGAHRGAAVLARAVVEATAKEKGIDSRNLIQMIDKMHEAMLIREHVRDAAHEIRFGGNGAAHGDVASEDLDSEATSEMLVLMDEILEEVFQSPARVQRVRAQRLVRETKAKEAAEAPF